MSTLCEILNEEYEAQFFGFTPTAFCNGLHEIMIDRVGEALDQLEKQLDEIPKEVLPAKELELGKAQLRALIDKSLNDVLAKLKTHIQTTLLKLPPYLLLASDVEQSGTATHQQVAMLRDEIATLHTQLKNEKYVLANLELELKEQEEVVAEQEKFLDMFNSDWDTEVDEIKEKLSFIGTSVQDMLAATDSLAKASKELPQCHDNEEETADDTVKFQEELIKTCLT